MYLMFQYESIFDNPPTFYEKKAFVDVFRKKWREDKGYCSMFDKRNQYKSAKSVATSKVRLTKLNTSEM
jgi:hypothetical protein